MSADDPKGAVPASAHYRDADSPSTSCGVCSWYQGGYCRMWDATVLTHKTCDDFEPRPAITANQGGTMTEIRGACGDTGLPLSTRTLAWDAGAATARVKKWASSDGSGDPDKIDYTKLRRGYFWCDTAGDGGPKIGDLKLPFADIIDGKLTAVWRGVTAAAGRLGQTQDIDADAVKPKIAAYYKKAAKQYDDDTIEVPWTATNDPGAIRYCVTHLTDIDVRDPSANDDGTWTMSGYAAVFNTPTVLYNGKFIKVTESIQPQFFDRTLREQGLDKPDGVVHYNLGHDMNRAVAATDVAAGQEGSLSLRADAKGLFFLAKVPKDDPDGVAMAVKMRSGVLKQASFAFTVRQANWTDTENAEGPDESHRDLVDCEHLYDVCACPQGAYSQTVSQLQRMAAALGQPQLEDLLERGGHPRQPTGGENEVNPDLRGGSAANRRLSSAVIRGLATHRR